MIAKFAGIPAASRKVAATVQPIVEIVQESDGKLTLSSSSPFKNISITFNLGEEFDEITPDGRKVKSIITLEGNKLIQIQKNGKESVTIREFTPEQVNMVNKSIILNFVDVCQRM